MFQPIRSVSVLREGYVELPSVSLDPQGELLASFSTRNDTGIILAGFSKASTRKSRQARQVRPQIYCDKQLDIIRAHTCSLVINLYNVAKMTYGSTAYWPCFLCVCVQPFLAVMLISGGLEVHVNMAEGGSVHKVVVKSRSGSFSDGQEHSVILQRNRKWVAPWRGTD